MSTSFEELFYCIKQQRKNIIAPVDKYGLVSIQNLYKKEEYRFLILVSLLLSSQTKDEYTSESVQNFEKGKILSFLSLSRLRIDEIYSKIKKVGFANKKSRFLYNLAHKYKYKNMPETLEEVLDMEGIGRKMAYLYLQYGCDKIEGVAVDTHVLRVSQRLGITTSKNAEVCRKRLEEIFDKSEWKNINYNIVGFGQVICQAKKPKCHICALKKTCISSLYTDW